jgi:hypothetical protein
MVLPFNQIATTYINILLFFNSFENYFTYKLWSLKILHSILILSLCSQISTSQFHLFSIYLTIILLNFSLGLNKMVYK